MKKQTPLLYVILFVGMIFSSMLNAQTATAPAGTGTVGDPYQITSVDNLYWMSLNTPSSAGKYYKQMNNIDASATSGWSSGDGFLQIGGSAYPFAGYYDGQNYSISNLTINRPLTQYVGLFGYTSGVAEISNVNLIAVSITGDDFVGGLVGFAYGNLVTNCKVTGSITGGEYTGGLIGANSDNTVTNSYSRANVTGVNYVGSLIGWEFDSIIRANYATGSVSSSSNDAGGLIGYAESSIISNCYSRGNVTRSTGTSTYFGAFIGEVIGATSISNSYSTGWVIYTGSTSLTTKGFVGYDNTTGGANTYTNNLWDNDASNQSTATGATSKTTVEMKDYRTYTATGWDFNYETTIGSNDYWDDDQLGTVNSYYPILYWQAGANDETFGQPSSGNGILGNPYQISTLDNLYWLSKNTSVWDKYFVQTQYVDASASTTWHNGLGIEPIGNATTAFSGNWTGLSDEVYIISGLNINRPNENYVGFFGITNGATIKYLEISHSDISGYDYVGSLVGYADYTNIQYCFSSDGTVSGNQNIGGLTGYNNNVNILNSRNSSNVTGSHIKIGGLAGNVSASSSSYKISECSNTGTVSGYSYVGGLAGLNNALIEKSYSTGNVSGSSSLVGGFVGDNYSAITNCYSKGNVTRGSGADDRYGSFVGIARSGTNISYCYSTGSVTYTGTTNPTTKGFVGIDEPGTGVFTANFFDTETSLQSTGIGATAKTTALMKTNSTYIDAGWDVNIWNIDASWNSGYPYFDWQNSGGTALPVELTSFTANLVDGKVELNWETATEVNNYGFDVETLHATSDEWQTIGFVQGSGNSNSPKNYTFVDENPLPDSAEYRLKQIDTDGNVSYYSETVKVAGFGTTDVNDESLPTEYNLSQNYPNPFNPSTTISYSIPTNVKSEMSNVKLIVFDILGKEVATLVNESQSAGNYKVEFNASSLSSGVYFYKLESGNFKQIKKLMLIK